MAIGPEFPTVLQAARVGAEWAWTVLYRDLSPQVLRYLNGQRVRDPEDRLGDVFVSVVRSIDTFEGGESDFRAWVFRCARNAVIDSWRRDGRRPLDLVPDEELHGAVTTLSAEDDALGGLELASVRTMLDRLSDRQREVIFLRVVVGLSIDECAAVLRRTPGSVKSLQLRGLATLKRIFFGEAVSK